MNIEVWLSHCQGPQRPNLCKLGLQYGRSKLSAGPIMTRPILLSFFKLCTLRLILNQYHTLLIVPCVKWDFGSLSLSPVWLLLDCNFAPLRGVRVSVCSLPPCVVYGWVCALCHPVWCTGECVFLWLLLDCNLVVTLATQCHTPLYYFLVDTSKLVAISNKFSELV